MLASRLVCTDHLVSDNVFDAVAHDARCPATQVRARLEYLFRNTPLQGAALLLCNEIESFRTREPA